MVNMSTSAPEVLNIYRKSKLVVKIVRELKMINALTSFGQNRIGLLKCFDRKFNSVRKKVCALNNPFAGTIYFRSFLPRATLLRRFALGYNMPPILG